MSAIAVYEVHFGIPVPFEIRLPAVEPDWSASLPGP